MIQFVVQHLAHRMIAHPQVDRIEHTVVEQVAGHLFDLTGNDVQILIFLQILDTEFRCVGVYIQLQLRIGFENSFRVTDVKVGCEVSANNNQEQQHDIPPEYHPKLVEVDSVHSRYGTSFLHSLLGTYQEYDDQ